MENRPGANAIIGSDYVAKAKPDGTTLLLADRMTVVANPLLYSKLPYDPKALQGVSDIARVNLALSVGANAPYQNWAEFIAYAKANPDKVSIGSGGPGSVHHLSLELLQKATGAKLALKGKRGRFGPYSSGLRSSGLRSTRLRSTARGGHRTHGVGSGTSRNVSPGLRKMVQRSNGQIVAFATPTTLDSGTMPPPGDPSL